MSDDDGPITVPDELSLPPPGAWPTELEHARSAKRLAFALACGLTIIMDLTAVTLLLEMRGNAFRTIVTSTAYAHWFMPVFLLVIAAQVPFLVSLLRGSNRWHGWGVVLSSLAGFAGGMTWLMAAAVGLHLDYGWYIVTLVLFGFADIGFGFLLAVSRNHKLLRELQGLPGARHAE